MNTNTAMDPSSSLCQLLHPFLQAWIVMAANRDPQRFPDPGRLERPSSAVRQLSTVS